MTGFNLPSEGKVLSSFFFITFQALLAGYFPACRS
jgi:hypothetical protein